MNAVYRIRLASATIAALLSLILNGNTSEVVVPLTVETNGSSAQMTLTVQGQTSSDTQRLGGSMQLGMDCYTPLTAVALRDFNLQASGTFNFHLSYGFFGDLFASVTNLQIRHGDPGPHRPFEPLSGTTVRFRDTPSALGGMAGYLATGLPCLVLEDGGLPCEGAISLADQPTNSIEEIVGTLTVSNGMVHFVGAFEFGPVELAAGATVSGMGTITARGLLRPCLQITLSPLLEEYRVSWSTAFQGFRLVRTSTLGSGANWADAVPKLGFTDGAHTNAVFESGPGNFFYRLEASVVP